jgi:hypothetical protein
MSLTCQPAASDVVPSPGGSFSTRAQIVLGACTCAGGSLFVYAVDPHQHAVYPQCLLYNTTGIYCAGCGATRAVYALLHGRVIEALHDNLLFIGALPFLGFVVGSYVLKAWQVDAWPQVSVDNRTLLRRGIWTLALLLGFMAVRNLPGWPFELLRPV